MSLPVLSPTDEGAPAIEARPLPLTDHVSEGYFAAAAEGRLLFQECAACGHRQFYPRACCTACAADTAWKEASGRGTVHTFTIIRQNWAMPFKDDLPYVVAMVELEEGVKMMTNITHCDPEAIEIGTPVEAYTVKVEDGLGLPFWRPATGG